MRPICAPITIAIQSIQFVYLIYGVTEVHVTAYDFALTSNVQVDPRVFIEINHNQRNAIRLRFL